VIYFLAQGSTKVASANKADQFMGNWEWGPSSDHPGGAQHLMGDASVQFVQDGIDKIVYFAVTTKGGHEPLGLSTEGYK
jgi:hypothetical protein